MSLAEVCPIVYKDYSCFINSFNKCFRLVIMSTWTNNKISELISFVHDNQLIWDIKHPDYLKRNLKIIAFNRIGETMRHRYPTDNDAMYSEDGKPYSYIMILNLLLIYKLHPGMIVCLILGFTVGKIRW